MSEYDPTDMHKQDRAKVDLHARVRNANDTEGADIKWLMGSKRGRRIMWRLLDQAGVHRLTFNTNAMQMAFAEGNRNYGNRILALVHSECPELYPTMVREQHDTRNADHD